MKREGKLFKNMTPLDLQSIEVGKESTASKHTADQVSDNYYKETILDYFKQVTALNLGFDIVSIEKDFLYGAYQLVFKKLKGFNNDDSEIIEELRSPFVSSLVTDVDEDFESFVSDLIANNYDSKIIEKMQQIANV